jgi:hypothetical protein
MMNRRLPTYLLGTELRKCALTALDALIAEDVPLFLLTFLDGCRELFLVATSTRTTPSWALASSGSKAAFQQSSITRWLKLNLAANFMKSMSVSKSLAPATKTELPAEAGWAVS